MEAVACLEFGLRTLLARGKAECDGATADEMLSRSGVIALLSGNGLAPSESVLTTGGYYPNGGPGYQCADCEVGTWGRSRFKLNHSDGTSHYSAELPITDNCQGSETTIYSIPSLTGVAGSVVSIELQARASMGPTCPSSSVSVRQEALGQLC